MTPSQAIAYLKRAGLTEVAIATAVGSRQSTINRIANGAQLPNWELGQALVRLAESTQLAAADDQPQAA